MRCIDSKRSNDIMCMEPNEKLQNYVIKFCGRSLRLDTFPRANYVCLC